MKQHKEFPIRLKIILLVFSILLVSNIILFAIYGIIINLRLIHPHQLNPLMTASTLLASSILISLLITPIFVNSLSNLVKRISKALNQVAKGDFSIQLDEDYFINKELKNLIITFNKMVRDLNSIETLRSDFISNFSHEFKTPIVSMLGFAKLLKDSNTTEEEKDEYINIIISESKRLSDLANNILFLSKLHSEEANFPKDSSFNIDEQIRQCVLLFAKEWEEKNINLNIDVEETKYIGNEELIHQIWVNLINNAIKFSKVNGNIEISAKKVDNMYVVKICDDGIGIDDDKISHIYDKFYQADSSHSTSGNGLGLSIVSEILKLHDGRVEVLSKLDEGTTFTVYLPLKENKNER